MKVEQSLSSKLRYLAIVLVYLIGGLAIFGSGGPSRYAEMPKTPGSHQYELSVVDVDGKPLEGVRIEYTSKVMGRIVERSSYPTSADGMLSKTVTVTIETRTLFSMSSFEFRATKDGYYPKTGKMSIDSLEDLQKPYATKRDKITLIRPIDYLNEEFALTLTDEKLKKKILTFIDLIILQGLVTESVLETHSVNLKPFKGNNYLQFKFVNANVYNSLKLDKYDIGKVLFDEVIRKILNPLNEHVAESKLFYGYDLTVVGHTKSFAEKYVSAKSIDYRFLIPEKIVRQYKNKDISGQQVLDASVILMDDERIELKLQ